MKFYFLSEYRIYTTLDICSIHNEKIYTLIGFIFPSIVSNLVQPGQVASSSQGDMIYQGFKSQGI